MPSTGAGFTDIAPHEFMPDSETAGGKYRLLLDKIIVVAPNGNNEKRHFKYSISGSKLQKLDYDTGLTTLATGNVGLFISCDDFVATGNVEMESNYKVFYTDV